MASSPSVLGNPLLKTQHFIGSSKWEKISDTEVVGWHQLRVPHQRYTDESKKEVAVKGHAHGTNQHWYRKVDGQWKFAGLAPEIKWGEFDFDKVFESGRETFGDDQEAKKEEIELAVAAGVVGKPNGVPTGEEVASLPAMNGILDERSAADMQPLHTASGIQSEIEKMPIQVSAMMMEGPT